MQSLGAESIFHTKKGDGEKVCVIRAWGQCIFDCKFQSWAHVPGDGIGIATVHFPEHLLSDVLLVVTANHRDDSEL